MEMDDRKRILLNHAAVISTLLEEKGVTASLSDLCLMREGDDWIEYRFSTGQPMDSLLRELLTKWPKVDRVSINHQPIGSFLGVKFRGVEVPV